MDMNFKMDTGKLGQKIRHCGHNTATQLHKLLLSHKDLKLFLKKHSYSQCVLLISHHNLFHTYLYIL